MTVAKIRGSVNKQKKVLRSLYTDKNINSNRSCNTPRAQNRALNLSTQASCVAVLNIPLVSRKRTRQNIAASPLLSSTVVKD